MESENPLQGENKLVRSEDPRRTLRNSESSHPTETKDEAQARNDFWSIDGDFIYRDHM